MTACDIAAIAKPWELQKEVSGQIGNVSLEIRQWQRNLEVSQ